jgi:hypothetical protein
MYLGKKETVETCQSVEACHIRRGFHVPSSSASRRSSSCGVGVAVMDLDGIRETRVVSELASAQNYNASFPAHLSGVIIFPLAGILPCRQSLPPLRHRPPRQCLPPQRRLTTLWSSISQKAAGMTATKRMPPLLSLCRKTWSNTKRIPRTQQAYYQPVISLCRKTWSNISSHTRARACSSFGRIALPRTPREDVSWRITWGLVGCRRPKSTDGR